MPMNKTKERCSWAQNDPLMCAYHDEEWGVPNYDSRSLWELLMLEGFQAGLSWIVVLRKREAFQAAFHQFDPKKVARMGEDDILRLLEDPRIIRSRSKIEATIAAARIFLDMQAKGEDLAEFIWSFVDGKPIQNTGPVPAQTSHSMELSKALKTRGFKFVGPTIVYAFMQAAGMVNDHAAACFRRAPVAKLGSAAGRSRSSRMVKSK
jgi:DNA-3-methyladenine glycosylase I